MSDSYVALSSRTERLYSLIRLMIPPGAGPPPHTHLLEHEGFYVLKGTFTVWVGGKPTEIHPGEHAFGPRGVEHYFRNTGEAEGNILLIFTPGGLEGYFQELAEVRRLNPSDLLDQEEAIDRRYGIIINRRS